jgi:hypothetical protein
MLQEWADITENLRVQKNELGYFFNKWQNSKDEVEEFLNTSMLNSNGAPYTREEYIDWSRSMMDTYTIMLERRAYLVSASEKIR